MRRARERFSGQHPQDMVLAVSDGIAGKSAD